MAVACGAVACGAVAVAVWRGRSHSTLEWSGYAPATQPHSHRAVRLCGYAARPWRCGRGGVAVRRGGVAQPRQFGFAWTHKGSAFKFGLRAGAGHIVLSTQKYLYICLI